MNILQEFVLLGTNSARTKAYLQIMAKAGYRPGSVVLMAADPDKIYQERIEYHESAIDFNANSDYFNLKEPVLVTLERLQLPYQVLLTDSVNSIETKQALEKSLASYVIYSGFGGQIVKKEVLALGKRFLHIHPGVVPTYRGSTTVYYSLLKEGRIGASAIFLEEQIDAGPIIKTKWFELKNIHPDLDYIVDPFIRADLLKEVISDYLNIGYFQERSQSKEMGETYYIIHPVLKHISILGLGSKGGGGE
ncbi:formyltransferase family protein [Cohnella rhizosphaerae]|uniref:Formyltransferase family protein n=1 Tax=Cohnella rhizosphaerae TaxID=1457232 RepID=A0A9X4KWN8_9BACL|nr:formyltransferase family protein [Cohnella rhizosphaerae]MDG0811898.1 formyltransferase family protein [Cohnella rhizosphaerae]